jgi:Domain of unknown function (DUF4340)
MKLQRTAFGLLFAAALLAGIVAVSEGQKKPLAQVDQPVSQRVFDFGEEAIAFVTIETTRPAPLPTPVASPTASANPSPTASANPSPTVSPNLIPQAIAVERVAGQWQLSAPLKVPANEPTVAFLTNLLTTTQRDRTLNVSPDRAAEFGLDKPMGTIGITLTDQQKHKLVLGKLSFDRTWLYALIDPDPNAKDLVVSLVSPQFANAVDRDLKEWQVVKPIAPAADQSPSPDASPAPKTSPQPEVTPSPTP